MGGGVELGLPILKYKRYGMTAAQITVENRVSWVVRVEQSVACEKKKKKKTEGKSAKNLFPRPAITAKREI